MRYTVPTVFEFQPFTAAGGLLSYGGSETDNYRLVGNYTGKILKGEKPADLPVQQATKVELIINLKTAKRARHNRPEIGAKPRRRGDRMKRRDVRYWHKADIPSALHMSAFGGKADMAFCTAHVRF